MLITPGQSAHTTERLRKGNFAYIAQSNMFDLLDPKERCDYYAVGGVLVKVYHAVAIRKGVLSNLRKILLLVTIGWSQVLQAYQTSDSPLRKILNEAIVENFADGTVKTLRDKWIPSGDGAVCNQVILS